MTQLERDRLFFRIAAGWNFAVSIPFLVAEAPLRALLQMPPPADPMMSQLFFVCVFCLGAGYWLVGQDPQANHGVVGLGAAVKAAVFVIVGAYCLMGRVGWPSLAPAVVDLTFAIMFVRFLRRPGALRSPRPWS
jgi:hypothetical protein